MKRILVADDEEHISNLISDCLKSDGYEVMSVNNGLLAYNVLRDSKYDLLITDIVMPDMDGLELIQKTKNLHPEIKIIAISAGGDLMEADLYLNPAKTFGADHRLNKPFELDDLMSKVVELVGDPGAD